MTPSNPIVKRIVQSIYFIMFFGLSIIILVLFAGFFNFVKSYGIDLKGFENFFSLILFLPLIAYSYWTSREASIAFSDDNCYFFEAFFVSIKRSFMYLPMLPLIGHFFYKEKENDLNCNSDLKVIENQTKKFDDQTRFDK